MVREFGVCVCEQYKIYSVRAAQRSERERRKRFPPLLVRLNAKLPEIYAGNIIHISSICVHGDRSGRRAVYLLRRSHSCFHR